MAALDFETPSPALACRVLIGVFHTRRHPATFRAVDSGRASLGLFFTGFCFLGIVDEAPLFALLVGDLMLLEFK